MSSFILATKLVADLYYREIKNIYINNICDSFAEFITRLIQKSCFYINLFLPEHSEIYHRAIIDVSLSRHF